jgi:hypothetical protein
MSRNAMYVWIALFAAMAISSVCGRSLFDDDAPVPAPAQAPVPSCWRFAAVKANHVELRQDHASIPFASATEAIAFARLHRLSICGVPATSEGEQGAPVAAGGDRAGEEVGAPPVPRRPLPGSGDGGGR